jgi:hypothetical protein
MRPVKVLGARRGSEGLGHVQERFIPMLLLYDRSSVGTIDRLFRSLGLLLGFCVIGSVERLGSPLLRTSRLGLVGGVLGFLVRWSLLLVRLAITAIRLAVFLAGEHG